MVEARTILEILPGVYSWQIFSPEHKVDFTSHLLVLDGKLFCFDPVQLPEAPMAQLSGLGMPEAIALTNGNHERDARAWQAKWPGVAVWAHPDCGLKYGGLRSLELDKPWNGFELHPIGGGSPGEVAFRLPALSLVLLGDAVVNLPDYPLQLLTERYCESRSELKKSLADLLIQPFERLLMAHGAPVLSAASKRLAEVLEGS